MVLFDMLDPAGRITVVIVLIVAVSLPDSALTNTTSTLVSPVT